MMASQLTSSMDTFFLNRCDNYSQSDTFNSDGMQFELIRLTSFKHWPRWSPISPNRLAKAGFYYTQRNDETECYSCHCKVSKWHEGDRPVDRHRLIKPHCPFVNNRDSTNVPLPRPSDSIDRPMNNFNASTIGNMQSSAATSSASFFRSDSSAQHQSEVPVSILLPNYQLESARLETFRNWPATAFVGPEELAQAGFVYLGSLDRVQCAFCKGVLKNWAPGDRAYTEHQKHFPQCPFVRNPSGATARAEIVTAAAAPYVPPTRSRAAQLQNTSSFNGSLAELGIETDLPKHHAFALEATRLASFNNWPSRNVTQQPSELAIAGFFYIGQADSVKCFWCDGGLRNWDANDDPWVEHARWFPKCGHVKRVKGARFIENVQASRQQNFVRDVDAREITSRLDTPVVKQVLEMGFKKQFVQNIIEYKLRTSGDDFASSEALLETCLKFTDSPPENFPLTHIELASTSATPPVEPPQLQEETVEPTMSKKGKKKKKKKNREATAVAGSSEAMETEEEEEGTGGKAVECKVCMDAEVNIVFLPCGHLVCCSRCAPALKNCPICRGLIRGTVNAILS